MFFTYSDVGDQPYLSYIVLCNLLLQFMTNTQKQDPAKNV